MSEETHVHIRTWVCRDDPPSPHLLYQRRRRALKRAKSPNTRGWGGSRTGSGNKTNAEKARRAALSRGAMAPPMQPQPTAPTTNPPSFTPRDSNRPVPLGNPKPTPTQTGRASFWSTVGVSHVEASASGSATIAERDATVFSPMNPLSSLRPSKSTMSTPILRAGDQLIDESLGDNIPDSAESNAAAAEAETQSSEPAPSSVIHKQLTAIQERLLEEETTHGKPLCYLCGDFFDRPPASRIRPPKNPEYNWVLMTIRLPRRVRAMPSDFFLFTNRFICDSRRVNSPGCGTSYQGTDPHIISQLPHFVQAAFLAYVSARGAISKLMMWQMSNTFATRFGPAPFSELVSEIQHRFHADRELMYFAAAVFYAFDDPNGYAGSPPSVQYIKALFTDNLTAHRIYIERDIATLPLTVAKADHTFDVLSQAHGWNERRTCLHCCLYTVLNEFEEVRAHSLTLTKSLLFVKDMFDGIQRGLKDSNNPPTEILYTDSPQSERTFHESINSALTKNVEPVTEWSDLPPFIRAPGVVTVSISDSMDIESMSNDILIDVGAADLSSQLYLVALAIKTEQLPGERVRLDIIQLRTKDKIYVFKVTALTSRSHVLPSLRAILTNPSIIKIGHSIRQTLETIAEAFSLPEINKIVKAKNAPILELGKYAKLKGVVDDPTVSLHALAGAILRNSFSIPHFSPYPWSNSTSSVQDEFLFKEVDCLWQISLSLHCRDSLGLPLQPAQAQTHGQLSTLVHGCKPVAEGSIVGAPSWIS
ncbi:hypothetical protein B0H14DRAFT_3687689 [Mycena olivaceomarginata]|nr:hypothetical protein B0H14DRAFT_3687689 [Mycena olivaceomarginata]